MRSDHKALMFIGVVAVLGVGVRVVRASGSAPKPAAQPALERQMNAADSAAKAGRLAKQGLVQQGPRRARPGHVADSAKRARDSVVRLSARPLERRGYIGGKLDLDVATLAQIDSLPGVTPLMARRIVLDRMARGPFVTRDGLRRVSGVGQIFLSRIDSLITFSGVVHMPEPADTAPPRRRGRLR